MLSTHRFMEPLPEDSGVGGNLEYKLPLTLGSQSRQTV